MLAINNTDKFNTIVKDALAKSANFPRWQNAINKAVTQISLNGDFMTYDETENYLVIWSQDSDKIYSANGVCQCEAYKRGVPCWHRSAARLVRLYLELAENPNPRFPNEAEHAPYLKPSTTKAPITVGRFRI